MNENKPILSIETSESLCGACVYFNDEKFFEASIRFKNIHAEKLFETIDYVIKTAGIETNDVGAIAVSAGPGSFTGLRIGMSAAKGIAFGLSLPIIPVPTFEALALQIAAHLPDKTEFIIANKVNMEEVYYAKFKTVSNLLDRSNNYIFAENLKIINLSELDILSKDCMIFGNVNVFKNEIDKEIKLNLHSGGIKLTAPSPVFVARWADLFGSDLAMTNYDYLEPNYLKNFIIKERKNV
ncbi:MAG: tRNA (adenosine(37)-N6)-threonylcarbamoyltransferase complex dimerization subunit type 1 TsaB [Ignavibacteriaceae bacterium]|nr:tRNA (adenosine(37)-N6)-threonylcarbamoyltransferase complex dimerization subunit type 1 TsaB [Ignavibacteriaceae bacterium]